MKRYGVYIICLFFSLSMSGQTLEELRKQKAEAEKAISFTNKLLDANKKSAQTSVNKLTLINRQIYSRQKLIKAMSMEIGLMDQGIEEKRNNIVTTEREIETLKKEYAKSVYQTWKTKSLNNRLVYVFSGQDLSQVYRRLRYLREFTSYRQQQGEKLINLKDELAKEVASLEDTRVSKLKVVSSKTVEQETLQKEKSRQNSYVIDLQKKERQLKSQLVQNKKKMNDLNKFIEKIIAEEIKKSQEGKPKGGLNLTPEEKLISDNFDKNKGRLPWPLEQGVITSKFGVFNNTLYKNVLEENFGIDIQTLEGQLVRAVFSGEVTGVYAVPGLNQVVIVRHGDYRTTYSNLEEVYVKKGDKLETKQSLGKVFTDEVNNKTSLHFQVWKGTQRLNPEYWISK